MLRVKRSPTWSGTAGPREGRPKRRFGERMPKQQRTRRRPQGATNHARAKRGRLLLCGGLHFEVVEARDGALTKGTLTHGDGNAEFGRLRVLERERVKQTEQTVPDDQVIDLLAELLAGPERWVDTGVGLARLRRLSTISRRSLTGTTTVWSNVATGSAPSPLTTKLAMPSARSARHGAMRREPSSG